MMRSSTPRSHSHRRGLLVFAAGFVFAAGGCATDSSDKWLRFFFDGVPPLRPAEVVESTQTDGTTGQPVAVVVEPAIAPLVVHVPFEERECSACHLPGASQGMKGPLLDVCFECHDDFLKGAKYKHGPAEDGDCLACHNAHKTQAKHLLTRTGKALCYECHDDVTEKAKYKHAPAEEGDCLACHDAHASKNRGLLKLAGAKTCYECHDEGDVMKSKAHATIEATGCTSCHDPHKGSTRALLKVAAGDK